MIQLFEFGSIHIYLLGVTIALGMLVGYYIALSEVKRKQLNVDVFSNLAMIVFISAILGARIFYIVVFNLDYYIESPIRILEISAGGLSVQGGLLFSAAFGFLYMKYKKISFLSYADAIAPAIPMGQFIGRIGCDVFGIPMDKTNFWGVYANGVLVHPVQIYEALLSLVLFGVLWHRRKNRAGVGHLFSSYLIGYGIIRFIIEFFRVNPLVYGPLTVAHVMSIIMIVVGIILKILMKNNIEASTENKEDAKSTIVLIVILSFVGLVGTSIFYTIR